MLWNQALAGLAALPLVFGRATTVLTTATSRALVIISQSDTDGSCRQPPAVTAINVFNSATVARGPSRLLSAFTGASGPPARVTGVPCAKSLFSSFSTAALLQQHEERDQQQLPNRRRRRNTLPRRCAVKHLWEQHCLWTLNWGLDGISLEEWSCLTNPSKALKHHGSPIQGGVTWVALVPLSTEKDKAGETGNSRNSIDLLEGFKAAAADACRKGVHDKSIYRLREAIWSKNKLLLYMSNSTDIGTTADNQQAWNYIECALQHAGIQFHPGIEVLRGLMRSQLSMGQLPHDGVKLSVGPRRRRKMLRNSPSIWWVVRSFAPCEWDPHINPKPGKFLGGRVLFSLHLCYEGGQFELIGRVSAFCRWEPVSAASARPRQQISNAAADDTSVGLTGVVDMLNFEICTKYTGKGYGKALLGIVERYALEWFGARAHVVAWDCTNKGERFFRSRGFKGINEDERVLVKMLR